MYKSGLVLEGGGIRALYESGVLDAFIENGIEFPYVIGVSAGSCNGVSYLGKNKGRMRDININYSGDKRYKSLKSIFKNGEYLNTKWVFGELSYNLFPLNHDVYENSNSVMCVAVTNALTGKPEYFYPKSLRNGCVELQASCAMPVITKAVKIGKDYYYDGGLTDSIPLSRAFDDGCEKCVVILTQDRSFVKQPIGHDKVVNRALKKYPLVAKALENRHIMYNKQREFVFEQENKGNVLVICPETPLHCGTLTITTQRQQEIYDMGYKQGLESIDKVKEFIRY